MRIYPDSSFLVSLLYTPDLHHAKAMAWFKGNLAEEWLISAWTEFETVNSLRSLCLRRGGPSTLVVETLRRWFKHLFTHGPLARERIDWHQAVIDANQISAGFASRIKARAADTLHIAILEQVQPDIFVTGDKDQFVLARARGFQSVSFI